MDTWDAVAAQVAAALRCSIAMGSSYLRYAVALRQRLPEVGKLFQAGEIDYRSFQAIVFRTDLVTDAEALARVDALLATRLSRYPSLTRGRLAAEVDRAVAKADRDAVRRAKEAFRDRYVDVTTDADMAYVTGNVLATAGLALDRRLNDLAATVCDADPRTREQRRADALGALAAGAGRLVCGCGSSDCGAAARVCSQRRRDSRGCRPGDSRGQQRRTRRDARRRRLDLGGDGGRDGQERTAAASDSAGRCARATLHPVGQARRLRAMPRPDLPRPGLRSPGRRLRSGSYCRLPRRRLDPRLKPEGSLSKTSPAEDFRRMARQAAARRHRDLAPSRRAHLRDDARQRAAVSESLRANRRPACAGHRTVRPTLRRARPR